LLGDVVRLAFLRKHTCIQNITLHNITLLHLCITLDYITLHSITLHAPLQQEWEPQSRANGRLIRIPLMLPALTSHCSHI
jgi:hypothetical protein